MKYFRNPFGYVIPHSEQILHEQRDIHMVVVVAAYRNGLVGTGSANLFFSCTNVVRNTTLGL